MKKKAPLRLTPLPLLGESIRLNGLASRSSTTLRLRERTLYQHRSPKSDIEARVTANPRPRRIRWVAVSDEDFFNPLTDAPEEVEIEVETPVLLFYLYLVSIWRNHASNKTSLVIDRETCGRP